MPKSRHQRFQENDSYTCLNRFEWRGNRGATKSWGYLELCCAALGHLGLHGVPVIRTKHPRDLVRHILPQMTGGI